MRTRLVCLLSTNGVDTNPPPVRARDEASSANHLSNTLIRNAGNGGRGRGGISRRGLPGRGGGVARNTSDKEVKGEELGKIPGDYKEFKDTSGNDVCVKFNKKDGCKEVTEGFF